MEAAKIDNVPSTELPEKRMWCRVVAMMKQSLYARSPRFIGGNSRGQLKRGVAEFTEESNRRNQLRDLCFSVCSAFQLSSVPRPADLRIMLAASLANGTRNTTMTHQPTPRIKKDWAKREWRSIVSNSDFFQSDIRRVTKKIDSELSEPTENEFGKYLSGSASLAALTAAHAIEMFDASRVDMGWELIATSLQYFLTEFKLDFAMGFPHAHPGVMNRASLIYCTALATKSSATALTGVV
ncbi:MAG TPA: hypothetical protein DDX19_12885, partial [Rhodopirellula baltica]